MIQPDDFSNDTSSHLTLEIVEQILKKDPYNTTFLYKKLNFLLKMGQHASALATVELLIRTLGYHVNLLNIKIFCLYELQKFQEAKQFINLYSHEFYNSISASTIYGMITRKLGDTRSDRQFFEVALREVLLDYDDLNVSLYSQALIKTGVFKEALHLLNDATSTFYYIFICRGDAYLGLQKYNEAEINYVEALKSNPDNFDSCLGLGKVYYHLKDYVKSLHYYQLAQKKRPNDLDLLAEINNINALSDLIKKANEEKQASKSSSDPLPNDEIKPETSSLDQPKDSNEEKKPENPSKEQSKKDMEEKKLVKSVERPKDMMEVDVPNDNNCLFWSFILGFLLPTLDQYSRFQNAFHVLIGSQCKSRTEIELHSAETQKSIFRLLKTYDVNKDSDIYKNPLMSLLCQFLRSRTVSEMSLFFSKEHRQNLARDVHKANWREYARWMRTPFAWGGESEIKAISNILKTSVTVFSKNYNMEYIHKQNDIPIYLVYTNATGMSQVTNHYHFLLNDKWYLKFIQKKPASPAPSATLFKPKENDSANGASEILDNFIINYYMV